MNANRVRDVVIVGGGTAGWMTAAALSRLLPEGYRLRLIESDEISTIGVGEATIPNIRNYNDALGIDEDDFVRNTQGTFKLGIEFVDWKNIGESYVHGFGKIGRDLGLLKFYQYWLKLHQAGEAPDLGEFSINTLAPRHAKFMRDVQSVPDSPVADIGYAFHFDAGLYARYLRRFSEARGVVRIEGKIVDTRLRAEDGFIEAVVMENGEQIAGDLFVDCSGMAGLLIEKALHTGFEDWSQWLPCNHAIAVPCESVDPLLPYTRSTARAAGWQWRIPLQHRIGNGHVFSSDFMDPGTAEEILMRNLDGKPLAAPRHIRFTTGKRKKGWNKNCVAIGLSGGFLEPLESTSIHLIQTAIARLVEFFPDKTFDSSDIDAFNAQVDFEYENIRDFLILHYKLNERTDSAFWAYCRDMAIPVTLRDKIDLFQSHGRIVRASEELFTDVSWVQVMHGQGLRPRSYHPLVDQRSNDEVRKFVTDIQAVIRKCVDVMPTHAEFIRNHCAAPAANPAWYSGLVS
ncbi:tryptophan halogenase family protein [Massilia rhizosphaerae]|uniref:tryptophan halogenase family protein n=1 Tax=Massilia rhizosphaerae TaxID=2784389 RepID=UPI0018DD4F27|nr:tryptophan halogenase family protein [Massilia rhizosphaerae]